MAQDPEPPRHDEGDPRPSLLSIDREAVRLVQAARFVQAARLSPRRRASWRKAAIWAVVFAAIIAAAFLMGPGH
jgi:hypothetical protein